MKKKYVIDTNVLLDDENAVVILRNGSENDIFIPHTVLQELDGLKKDNRLKHKVQATIECFLKHDDWINVLKKCEKKGTLTNDERILEEINQSDENDLILVTNDKALRFRAKKMGIKAESYKHSNPFKAESQKYSGFINLDEGETFIPNCFYWSEGKLHYNSRDGEKLIDYEHEIWSTKPRTPYQQAAFELMLDPKIDIISIQSEAGFGKTYISLATAMYHMLEKKNYDKIYVVKPNIEIGEKMGFLPGDVDEKMGPYFRAIQDLIEKLHGKRSANRLFLDPNSNTLELNNKKIELLPINFLRGMNIENAVVIIDEIQNLSRSETRTVLSRMGENVKCICLGDVRQVDNIHLNPENNGLNWIVKKFKGESNYGHVVLSGKTSRGPIADLVRKTGL